MQVIKNQKIDDVEWVIHENEMPLDAEHLLVSVSTWNEHNAELDGRIKNIGLILEPDDDLQSIAREIDLTQFSALAIRFPKAVDGRGYSLARMLRERYSYEGDLLAIGDVLIDQLWLMHRCGFNVLVLRADQDIKFAESQLKPFSEQYQSDALEKKPLYRRRQPAEIA